MSCLQDLSSASDGVSLNGSDQRFTYAVVPQQCLPVQIGVGRPALLVGVWAGIVIGAGLEIHTCAERPARPSQDRTADVVILVESNPSIGQAHDHCGTEGVLGLGPVHGDHQCVSHHFGQQMLGARHDFSLVDVKLLPYLLLRNAVVRLHRPRCASTHICQQRLITSPTSLKQR